MLKLASPQRHAMRAQQAANRCYGNVDHRFVGALGCIIVSLQARQLPSKPELLGELAELCDCGQRTLALAVLPQVRWLGGWAGGAARPHNRLYLPGTPCGFV